MEYMDWVELGMNKRARKMTRQDVAEAMGFKGKGAASHKFKGRRDTTNKTADDVFKMLAAVGWQAVIFDSNGKIVMGTAHVDSPDGMEQKFIKRCEELARENEALKAEIDMLKNQLNNKSDIVDKPVNQQIETKGDAIVGEPVMMDLSNKSDIAEEPVKQQKAAGGRPAKFKVEQLEQWLKEQGGYKGTIDELALHAFGKVGKDGKLHGAPGRHWMYKALAKLEDEGKIVKEAATRSGINIVA
ncbi:XRE family transcriptional regulator [Escherichia coli]|uniref:XRE family transcriptional regulator n=1 Tax=Escherichia coli TaxID=562 RepID=UPI0013CB5927|nr:XRE family transcriptional regulator [Escherichia coli]EEW8433080.1 XRE family transcriptional regulator [Escherichia coli]EEY1458593.1 XRE family transcriptional regulator [Escherichia coli]EJV3641346.1 XRE family transcriptional regulator [Escherichia coli]EJV3685657.1 XRE family transcriptional regulator [Escherichia coli]MBA5677706.1 XRE family transcriptional regulator [Escherichia coli]